MKIIYIAFILLLPLRVSAENCSVLINDTCSATNAEQCGSCGCFWNSGMDGEGPGTCEQCQAGYYSNNASSNCAPCSDYSYPEGSHKTFDTSYNDTRGLSSCPWVCYMGYYRSSYNADTGAGECTACPNNSTSAQGATDINACTCQSGYYKTTNADGALINNTFTCQLCDNLTNCNNNATSATVGCPSGSYKTINLSTGVVTCTPCGDYAFVRNNNECVCKGNTYGNPYEGCTKCPAGMLTVVNTSAETAIHDPNFQGEPGATEKSQCKIGAFTKFCNGNGTHCMRLMQ